MIEIPKLVEEGGMAGTVIVGFYISIKLFVNFISKKDSEHREFMKEVMHNDREDRKLNNSDHKESYSRLSASLDNLASELKK